MAVKKGGERKEDRLETARKLRDPSGHKKVRAEELRRGQREKEMMGGGEWLKNSNSYSQGLAVCDVRLGIAGIENVRGRKGV